MWLVTTIWDSRYLDINQCSNCMLIFFYLLNLYFVCANLLNDFPISLLPTSDISWGLLTSTQQTYFFPFPKLLPKHFHQCNLRHLEGLTYGQ